MYNSWWNLDIGLPEYRHRDRLFFLFARYCSTTTTATFFWRIFDDDGGVQYFSTETEALRYCGQNNILRQPENGIWEIDYGRRTCLGFNYPKHRREGATYKGSLINYEIKPEETGFNMEAYWDVFWYPIMCEFTVQKPMAQNAFLWGYLAGVHAEPPR